MLVLLLVQKNTAGSFWLRRYERYETELKFAIS